LVAIGIFNLAPHAVDGDNFDRQILAFVDPFDRKFGTRTRSHPRLGFLNRGPIRRLLLRLRHRLRARKDRASHCN
jgi:hypothetical protein